MTPRSLALLTALLVACSDGPADGGLVTEDFFAHAEQMHDTLFRVDTTLDEPVDQVTGQCAEAAGADRIYRFVAPTTGIARFALRGSAPVLYARTRAHDPSTELACSSEVEPLSQRAEIFFDMTKGETYFVIADRLGPATPGAWQLELELRPSFANLGALAGKYRSRGYGLVLAFNESEFVLREESGLHCMTVLGGPTASLAGVVESIEPGPDPDTIAVTPLLSASPIVFEPLGDAPALCKGEGTPVVGSAAYQRDPLALFDIFAGAFRDHYAFFAQRGLDPEALITTARSGLTSDSSDEQLFASMVALAAPLHDGHVSVTSETASFESKPQQLATIFASEVAAPADAEAYVDEQVRRARAIADAAIVGPLTRFEKLFVAGRLAGNVGYLRLEHLVVFRADLPLYLKALDAALATLADTPRIVIDLRFNGGGSDLAAIAVANRFVRHANVFARKQARAGDGVTPATDLAVAPVATAYAGSVIVLANGSTASAGEILVLALRGQPGITVTGWNTSGEFSDILSRQLPNGWSFGLSNEIYRDKSGSLYEVTGIPPDVRIAGEPFPLADRIDGVDRVLASAAAMTFWVDTAAPPVNGLVVQTR